MVVVVLSALLLCALEPLTLQFWFVLGVFFLLPIRWYFFLNTLFFLDNLWFFFFILFFLPELIYFFPALLLSHLFFTPGKMKTGLSLFQIFPGNQWNEALTLFIGSFFFHDITGSGLFLSGACLLDGLRSNWLFRDFLWLKPLFSFFNSGIDYNENVHVFKAVFTIFFLFFRFWKCMLSVYGCLKIPDFLFWTSQENCQLSSISSLR